MQGDSDGESQAMCPACPRALSASGSLCGAVRIGVMAWMQCGSGTIVCVSHDMQDGPAGQAFLQAGRRHDQRASAYLTDTQLSRLKRLPRFTKGQCSSPDN